MDNKNVFVAIALSMSVLLFWSAFFPPPEPTKKTNTEINRSRLYNGNKYWDRI